MRVINVVKIKNGVVDEISSFAVVEEQLSQEVVDEAEKKFLEEAKFLGCDTEDEDLVESVLDDGYFEKDTTNDVFPEPASVCISWSQIYI